MRIKLHLYCTVLFVTGALLLLMHSNAFSDFPTNLVFSGYLQDSSGDMDVGGFSVPVVYDWNNDGKKDLLVGQRYIDANNVSHGYVSYYENTGTNASPLFNSPMYMEACNTICNYLDVTASG